MRCLIYGHQELHSISIHTEIYSQLFLFQKMCHVLHQLCNSDSRKTQGLLVDITFMIKLSFVSSLVA